MDSNKFENPIVGEDFAIYYDTTKDEEEEYIEHTYTLWYRKIIEDKVVEETMVGYIKLQQKIYRETAEYGNPIITDIFIYPDFRKQGLATMLVSKVFKHQNPRFCFVPVKDKELALPFWRNLGFLYSFADPWEVHRKDPTKYILLERIWRSHHD